MTEPLLRATHLRKTYRDGDVTALVDVDLTIATGEYVAITGPSGSGKSTLLHLLGALDRPCSGEVWFRGQPLSRCRDLNAFRARQLGFVFQAFCLLPTLTALENVQVPLFASDIPRRLWLDRARELLRLVDLDHRRGHRPCELSVGERQRVAIARALVNDPALVLADEPTGNLDSRRTAEILDLFDRLRSCRSLTLAVVTHSPEVAARADRRIHVRDGRIIPLEQRPQLRLVA